jgi:DNA adenine methylase
VRLQAVKGLVVLSGYRSPLYDALLAGWLRLDAHARAQGNLPRVECAWLNPAAAAAAPQALLALEAQA